MIYETIFEKLMELGVIELISNNTEAAKAKSGPYMDLNFDRLTHKENDGYAVIALAHNYIQNGDVMADPDMEIRVYPPTKTAEALTYQQSSLCVYQQVYPEPDMVNTTLKKQLNTFLNQWLTNLINQGFSFQESNPNPTVL